ncbi:hypothetical protein O4159_10775 [Gordonia terrae]|uniref:hypothetical protein n=1 Tax=Gordonia hongkongensis TaxID=1701090 RepID=UPI0022B4A1B9|nr:hypothetical protein [Gordonia terrae]
MGSDVIEGLRRANPGYHPGWGQGEYTDWQDEQMSWKTTCYLGDWSFLWDVVVEGSDALRVFSDTCINSFEKFPVGRAKHIVQCTSDGKVIGDGVLMRLGEDKFITQGVPAMHTSWVLSKGGYDATWTQVDRTKLQVSGPNALAVCQKVTGQALTDIKFMHFGDVEIGGHPVWALRQGMAGEVGFEFHAAQEHREEITAAILAAGAEFGIRRLGRRTVMINHLEAAFPTGNWHYLKQSFHPELAGSGEWIRERFDTYGLVSTIRGSFDSDDVNDYLQSPVTLGWGKSIKFDHEFVGREALEAEMANPNAQRVTLEFDSEDVVAIYASMFADGEPYAFLDVPHPQRWIAWADKVLGPDGDVVGLSSVPGYSFFFRKVLTIAYIDPALAEPGTRLTVVWGEPGRRQKNIGVTVARAPYKTDNRRVDLATVDPRTPAHPS